MAISPELIAGIIIIAVGIITLIRIIKPLLEGIIIIVVIIIGSALIFHTSPIIGLPNFHLPVNIGPNIMGVNPGVNRTLNIIVFNAYSFSINNFKVKINNESVRVLNNLTIPPGKFGSLIVNYSKTGIIDLSASSDVFGFELGTVSTSYNYSS